MYRPIVIIMVLEALAGLALLDQFYGGAFMASFLTWLGEVWSVFGGAASSLWEGAHTMYHVGVDIDLAVTLATAIGALFGLITAAFLWYWCFIYTARLVIFVARLAARMGRARWSVASLWHRAIADTYGVREVEHVFPERITVSEVVRKVESYGNVTMLVRDEFGKEFEIVASAKTANDFDGISGYGCSINVEECLKPVSPVGNWDSRKACFGHLLKREDGGKLVRIGMFTRLGELCVVATHEIRGTDEVWLAPATKGKFEKADILIRVPEKLFKAIGGADISYAKLTNSMWSTLGCARGVPMKLNTKSATVRTYVPDQNGAIRCADGTGKLSSDLQTFDYTSSTQRGSSGGPVTNPGGVNVYAVHTTGTPDPNLPNHGFPAMYIWHKAMYGVEESDYTLGWLGDDFDYDPFAEEDLNLFAGKRKTRKLRNVRRSVTNASEYLVEDAYGNVEIVDADSISETAARYFHFYLERHGHVDESCWEVVAHASSHDTSEVDAGSVDLACNEKLDEVEESFSSVEEIEAIMKKFKDIEEQLSKIQKVRNASVGTTGASSPDSAAGAAGAGAKSKSSRKKKKVEAAKSSVKPSITEAPVKAGPVGAKAKKVAESLN